MFSFVNMEVEMVDKTTPVAVEAASVEPRLRSNYPAPFAARVEGRIKRPLGDVFGLANFGVNLTTLKPGAVSALRHSHLKQDELVYALSGTAVLVTNRGETVLKPGMCAGFKANTGDAHHIVNRGTEDFVYLEVGDRTPGEEATYPDDDLMLKAGPDGKYLFLHKDGRPYA
jgi:uncharacterized cupin superfamily protein